MKIKLLNIIYFLLAALLVFVACEVDNTEYSSTPSIKFLNSEVGFGFDLIGNEVKLLTLEFYLIDGDGDFGLPESPEPPYVGDSAFNYFFDLYYIENSELILSPILEDSAKYYRIPYLPTYGLDPTLKANVYIDYEFTKTLFPYDSVMFAFYVMDRAFNKSNVEWTDTIVFTSGL